MKGSPEDSITIGSLAPAIELTGTDGMEYAPLDDGAPVRVIVFTCNHCPYALAWHDRFLQAARDYADCGVTFYAINSNDAARYPADSFDAMKDRVRDEPWPMPYLHDNDQVVARAFGAQTTPQVFVLDAEGRVRYSGAPDGDYSDREAGAVWLRGAVDSVLAGREPDPESTEPVGCSIKWFPEAG